MIYKTETGSLYQVDEENKRVRRIEGVKAPTPRQGKDGEWKEYKVFQRLSDGCLWFDWTGLGNGTVTSRVVEEREEN